jgi:hypothetical protein
MSLSVGDAFKDGFNDFASLKGLTMAGILILFGLVNTVVQQTFSQAITVAMLDSFGASQEVMQQATGGGSTVLALGLGLAISVVLWLLFVVVLSPIVNMVVVRGFGSPSDDPLPMDDITADFAGTTLNVVIVSLVVGIATIVGLLFLVIPGIIVALVLYFANQYVVLSGDGPIEAIGNSIDLVKENIVPVVIIAVGLYAITFGITFAVGIPLGLIGGVVSPAIPPIFNAVFGGLLGAFGVAVATNAFLQVESASALEGGSDDSVAY